MAEFKAIVDSKGVMTGYDGCYTIVKAEDFPEGIKSIAPGAFKEVLGRYIVELTLPNCVSSIPDSTFEGCRELKSVVLPSSVNYIGSNAFRDCVKLESVVIPEIDTLPDGLFQGCSNLREIDFVRNNPELKVSLSSSKFQISLSESVKNVGDNVFAGCKKIQTIDLNSVKEIGEGAFANCDGLQSITLPYSVTTLLTSTFEGCSKLTSVVIPDSLREIEENAFAGCEKLKEVSLYIKVNDGKSDTFEDVQIARNIDFAENAFEGCKRLKSFSVRIENIQNMTYELKSIAVGKLFDLRNAYFGNLNTLKDGENEKVIFAIPGLPEESSYDTSFNLFAQFNKLLLTYLRYLEPNHRSTIWVMDERKFKELPSVIFSNILVLPKISGCDKLFMSGSRYIYDQEPELGDPDNGVWLLHPCADWYYSDDQLSEADRNNKDLFFFKEKYREFMHYAHSLGADYYHIDRKNTFNDTNNVTENKGFNVGANADEYGDAKIDRTVKNGNERISDIINEISNDFAWATHEPYTLTRMDIWRGRCWKDIDKMLNSDGKYTEKVKLHDKNTHSQNNSKDLKTQLGIIAKVLNIGTNFDRDKSETQKSDRLDELEINIIVEKGHNPSPEPKSDDSEKKKTELPESQGASKSLKYSDWGKNLFERPDDTKELLDVVNNNKFVNLVAMGGSGKTSLVKLFMAEYETSFDRIEYSLINNKLSSDIFSNNSTLKDFFDNDKLLKEIKDNEDKFANAINVLQNCETKNNLWIIDINETSDYKEIENIIDAWISQSNQIVSPWKNWRFLFVGRKCFHNIETNLFVPYDLKNTHDVLSGIFFNYLGNRTVNYQQRVSDGKINLDELFSGLFDLPILVEHTARFLSKWPVVCETTDAIFKIIDPKGDNKKASNEFLKELKAEGPAFWNKNQDFTNSPQYKNVADFLTCLLFFDDLKEDQKYVCRHFMLWPAEPLTLKGIHLLIGDEEDYSELKLGLCLVGLEEERIIVGDNKDGEKAYKMHALTADAFRVQVLKEKKVDERYRDYSHYLVNVKKFKRIGLSNWPSVINCLSFCFVYTKKASEKFLPVEFFDNDERFFNAKFYNKLAGLTNETPLYEKWYKLKLIEEVCGIKDHTQKFDKYQAYIGKSSHKVYEDNYKLSQCNEIDQDLKNEVLSQMVKLKGDEFKMGNAENVDYELEKDEDDCDDEKPIHNVKISSFYIGKYPVTQKLWKRVMYGLPDNIYKVDRFRGLHKPIMYVSWYDCMDFTIKLNAKTGLLFRLPTEAEWEYACRYSGVENFELDEVAWYDENSEDSLHEVGTTIMASELKIQDMFGNVSEWCQDWYGSYKEAVPPDPKGPDSGLERVTRGGGWDGLAEDCWVTRRGNEVPYECNYNIGFRLALSLPSQE